MKNSTLLQMHEITNAVYFGTPSGKTYIAKGNFKLVLGRFQANNANLATKSRRRYPDSVKRTPQSHSVRGESAPLRLSTMNRRSRNSFHVQTYQQLPTRWHKYLQSHELIQVLLCVF